MRWLIALLALAAIGSRAAGEIAASIKLETGAHVEVTVRRGQTLEARLTTNPSTGYSWEIVKGDTAIVALTALRNEPFDASPHTPAVGASSMQVLVFEAKAVGKTDLVLGYVRPWEKSVPPVKTAELSVTVTE
jgi:inhibitor of cysteine peptidase